MPIVRERNATVFDYLNNAVLVIDEPSAVDTYLGEVYQTLADRFAETDAADDIALRPEELYLSAEELRTRLDHYSESNCDAGSGRRRTRSGHGARCGSAPGSTRPGAKSVQAFVPFPVAEQPPKSSGKHSPR